MKTLMCNGHPLENTHQDKVHCATCGAPIHPMEIDDVPLIHRESILDFPKLMAAATEAQKQIDLWPEWKKEIAQGYFVSRIENVETKSTKHTR